MRNKKTNLEARKADVEQVKVYSCSTCANRKSPLCDECTQITATDGSEGKPKYYIYYDGSIPGGQYRRLEGRAETCAELLELYLRSGWPLPVAIVMEYNGHIEKQREERHSIK